MKSVKIEGHRGKWSSIESIIVAGIKLHLMEHDTYGEDADMVIINQYGKIIAEDVCNGFDDIDTRTVILL